MAGKGKSIERDESVQRLPDDVIKAIFTRLSARSLGQFRCLSRRWFSYLTDPEFIYNHSIQTVARSSARSREMEDDQQNLFCLLLNTKTLYKVNLETYLKERKMTFVNEKEEEEEEEKEEDEEEEDEEEEDYDDGEKEGEDGHGKEDEEIDNDEKDLLLQTNLYKVNLDTYLNDRIITFEEDEDDEGDEDENEDRHKDNEEDEDEEEGKKEDEEDDENEDQDEGEEEEIFETYSSGRKMTVGDNKERILAQLEKNYSCSIIGSSHGLICIKQANISTNDVYVIINPLTNEFRRVTCFDEGLSKKCYYYGFGYDPLTRDHKIVKISSLNNDDYVVEIFPLKSNCWRIIEKDDRTSIRIPFLLLPSSSFGEVGGVLHWKICNYISSKKNKSILTFDLGTHNCGMLDFISREDDDDDEDDDWMSNIIIGVSVFEGCLCVTQRRGNGGFIMWTMKEYGVVESWTKLMEIKENIPRFYPTPICYANNGRLILLKDARVNALYTVEDGTVRRFNKMVKESVFSYTQTLISPLM